MEICRAALGFAVEPVMNMVQQNDVCSRTAPGTSRPHNLQSREAGIGIIGYRRPRVCPLVYRIKEDCEIKGDDKDDDPGRSVLTCSPALPCSGRTRALPFSITVASIIWHRSSPPSSPRRPLCRCAASNCSKHRAVL